jgi:hypothetical protein
LIDNELDRNHRRIKNHPDLLSIFDTFKETFLLWRRNFWYLVSLSVIFLPPDALLTFVHHAALAPDSHRSGLFEFLLSSAQLVLDMAQVGAFFGLLERRTTESAWAAALHRSITYLLPLLGVQVLIILGALPLMAAGALLVHCYGSRAKAFPHISFYLFFLFCSLASVLVAQEKLGAVVAFKRGLGMTRRHLLFVAGCVLIPMAAEWFIRRSIAMPIDSGNDEISWNRTVNAVFSGILGSAWATLFWVMCRRIRTVEVRLSSSANSSIP